MTRVDVSRVRARRHFSERTRNPEGTELMHGGEFDRMGPAAEAPAVVVSLRCESCLDDVHPQPACPYCSGSGIELIRVLPSHASLPASELRTLYGRRPRAHGSDPEASS